MAARAAVFAAQNAGKQMLENNSNWAVIGDVLNSAKPASRVVSTLKGAGKTVHLVNPRDNTGTCFAGLTDISEPIDVVDLCINHTEGLKQMNQASTLGLKKVWIQPGAESQEILDFCKARDIEVFQGCVMVEMGAAH